MEAGPFRKPDQDKEWEANSIRINQTHRGLIESLGDSEEEYDYFTEWGVFKDLEMLLEPYQFSRKAVETLTPFVDKYLELLGYSLFIDEAASEYNDFRGQLRQFDQYHLGF